MSKGEGSNGSRIVKWVYFIWMFVVFTGLKMLLRNDSELQQKCVCGSTIGFIVILLEY